jgi:hypothetical protein
MTYLSGTTTELVRRNDILHMAFSRFDLFDRGWTEQQIKYDLGTPDFRVRVGQRNTGPVLYWKKARVREIEARIGITFQKFEDWYEEWKRTTATLLEQSRGSIQRGV